MTESRDHRCPRCGGYLPVVTVQKPVYEEVVRVHMPVSTTFLKGYEEVEEVAECVRCTGGY